MSDIHALASLAVVIFVRDEDRDENGLISYDELGFVQLPIGDLIAKGKAMADTIMVTNWWLHLDKTSLWSEGPNGRELQKMTRVDGMIKVTTSITFSNADFQRIAEQVASATGDYSVPTDEKKQVMDKTLVTQLQSLFKPKKTERGFSTGNTSTSSDRSLSASGSPSRGRPSSSSSASDDESVGGFSTLRRSLSRERSGKSGARKSVAPSPVRGRSSSRGRRSVNAVS